MRILINWFDIPANDIYRAADFYSKVLQMELSVVDSDDEKMACFPKGYNISGAITQHKDFKPSPDGVIISFYAGADMQDFLERIHNSGGKILIPKTKIYAENIGYFATFSDTEGNTIGVYSKK